MRLPQYRSIPLKESEVVVLQYLLMHKCSVCPYAVSYHETEHGLLTLLGYIDGKLLRCDTELSDHYGTIIHAMARLHMVPVPPEVNVGAQTEKFFNIILEGIKLNADYQGKLRRVFYYFYYRIIYYNPLIRPALVHSDLHAGNIIFTDQRECCFIDFEYAIFYYNYYDIVCFMFEFCGIGCDLYHYPDPATRSAIVIEYFDYLGVHLAVLDCIYLETLRFFEILVAGVWATWGRALGYRDYADNREAFFYDALSKFNCL